MRHIFFYFVFALILRMCAGCSSVPMMPQSGLYASFSLMGVGTFPLQAAPIPPSQVGYGARPPMHWAGNTATLTLINTTREYQARCWINEVQHVRGVYGAVPLAIARTKNGEEMAPLIPPGGQSFLFLPEDSNTIKCQLYKGPVGWRLMGGRPVGIYRLKYETIIRDADSEHFPDRTLRIERWGMYEAS